MATQQTSLLLGPDDSSRLVSAEEYAGARFVEPWTYEREDGRLLVVSPEGQRLEDSKPWRLRLSRYWIEHPEVVEELVIQAWSTYRFPLLPARWRSRAARSIRGQERSPSGRGEPRSVEYVRPSRTPDA